MGTTIIKHQVVNKTQRSGISFAGLLFIIFLTLKLTGVIAWSWWWVTAPLWAGVAIMFGFAIFALLIFLFAAIISVLADKPPKRKKRQMPRRPQ